MLTIFYRYSSLSDLTSVMEPPHFSPCSHSHQPGVLSSGWPEEEERELSVETSFSSSAGWRSASHPALCFIPLKVAGPILLVFIAESNLPLCPPLIV